MRDGLHVKTSKSEEKLMQLWVCVNKLQLCIGLNKRAILTVPSRNILHKRVTCSLHGFSRSLQKTRHRTLRGSKLTIANIGFSRKFIGMDILLAFRGEKVKIWE